jgi:hypothetical protein
MSQLHRQKVAEADAKAAEPCKPPDSKPEMAAVARRKSRWDVGESDEGDSNGQKRAREEGEGGEGGEGGGGSGLDGDPIGTEFTCFTSTKVQILTPDERFAVCLLYLEQFFFGSLLGLLVQKYRY